MKDKDVMDGELLRYCKHCGEDQWHRYKFYVDKVLFFCNACGELDIKPIPKDLLKFYSI